MVLEVTHEEIAQKAYELSVLQESDSEIWNYLGIEPDEGIVFSLAVEDANGEAILALNAFNSLPSDLSSFTVDRLPTADEITPIALIRTGAHVEDNLLRVCSHFYDPKLDRPLSHPLLSFGCGLAIGTNTSPDWALEDSESMGPFSNFRQQSFSYYDANDYYFNAIVTSDAEERKLWQTMLFRSIGHILHHTGDMSQPQHVRNDAHINNEGGDEWFEAYTGEVIQGEGVDGSLQDQLLATFNGYDPVKLDKARSYWATDVGGYDGVGLAEFTNREFVSNDTNFGMVDAANYEFPSLTESGAVINNIEDISPVFQKFNLSVPSLCNDPQSPCAMSFASTVVTDNLRPDTTQRNEYTSTESIFNAEIDTYNFNNPPNFIPGRRQEIVKRWTLNKINFWSSYPFLFSRSSGYSAGLINHFFRGKLEVNAPEDGVIGIVDHSNAQSENSGFDKIKLRIKNDTESIRDEGSGELLDQVLQDGVLVAVAKFKRNLCYKPDLSGEISGNRLSNDDLEWYLDNRSTLQVRSNVSLLPVKEYGDRIRWRPRLTISESQLLFKDFSTIDGKPVIADGKVTEDCVSAEYDYVSSKEFQVDSGALDISEGLEVVFDFSENPIPMDASFNLDITVAFKGNVKGGESDTGVSESIIAVGQRDISEPTYFSVVNSSDAFQGRNSIFMPPSGFTPDFEIPQEFEEVITDQDIRKYIDPEDVLNVSFELDGKEIASIDRLAPSSFARFALLLDLGDDANPLDSNGGLRRYTYKTTRDFASRDVLFDIFSRGIEIFGTSLCSGNTTCLIEEVDIDFVPTVNGEYELEDGTMAFVLRQYYDFRGWVYTDSQYRQPVNSIDQDQAGTQFVLSSSVFLKNWISSIYLGLHPFYDGFDPIEYPQGQPVVPGFFHDDPGVISPLVNKDNPTAFTNLRTLE